jgi:hypothetical protein
MLAVADRFEADLPVAEVDVTSTADLTRLLEPSAPASPSSTFRYARTKRAALTVAGSEHLGLPEVFSQLESVDVCMGWFGRWTRPVRAATTVGLDTLKLGAAEAGLHEADESSTRRP